MNNKNLNKIIFSVIFSSLFSVTTTWASTIAGSVSAATGGTGRGTVEPVDGVLMNPASVALIKSKFFSFNYSKDQMGVTISDNGKTALFPAAIAFVRTEKDNLKTQDMALVLAFSALKRLSFGSTISLVEYLQDVNGVEQKYRQTVGDLGATYIVSREMSLGAVMNKAFSSSTEIAPALQKQKTFGFGGNYTYENFVRFRFDLESAPENKTDRLVYMGGVETFLNDWIVARVGYQNNNVLAKNFATAGVGFSGPQFGLHYAYLTNVADRSDDRHSVDLGIPF